MNHAPDLRCPACQKSTQSLKQFKLWYRVIFLFAYLRHQTVQYTACPSCMRKFIFKRSALNLLTGHIWFALLNLPFHVHQYVRTFSSGHCAKTGERFQYAYFAIPAVIFLGLYFWEN